MERSTNEHAILWSCNFALASNANAARMTNHFTNHVFCCMPMPALFQRLHVHFSTANWPFGDVIRPNVGSHRGRRFTEPKIENDGIFLSIKRDEEGK